MYFINSTNILQFMSVRRIIVNSKVGGTPPKKPATPEGQNSRGSASPVPPEEIAFLKGENTRLEAELQASVDNLLIVVDEVKFLEEDVRKTSPLLHLFTISTTTNALPSLLRHNTHGA